MNNKDAIRVLESTKKEYIQALEIGSVLVLHKKLYEQYVDAYDLAIQALEKQIAKRPVIESWLPALCPTCSEELSNDLGDGYYEHSTFLERCPNVDCSQRLDWD